MLSWISQALDLGDGVSAAMAADNIAMVSFSSLLAQGLRATNDASV